MLHTSPKDRYAAYEITEAEKMFQEKQSGSKRKLDLSGGIK